MAKTADYTKKAVKAYREKFYIRQLRLDKELTTPCKDRAKQLGLSENDYIASLVKNDLEKSGMIPKSELPFK